MCFCVSDDDMISTVTVSTVTTVTTIAALGLAGAVGILGVALLISLLVSKELLGASDGSRQHLVSRCLNISIIPLCFAFATIVILKVVEILH